ncbi:MAG: trehalose-phosphatase [Bacteroidales bacterium]
METSMLKIYDIGAMIIVQGKGELSPKHLSGWKDSYTRIVVVHPHEESSEKMSGKLDGVVEFEYTAERDSTPKKTLDSVLKKLDVPAGQTGLVAEDPDYISRAGKMGMAMVIGIPDGIPEKKRLYEKGANVVMERLDDIGVYMGSNDTCSFSQSLPNVFTDLNKFETPFLDREPVFFLDYDGTLTPIVKDPSGALLQDDMRDLLRGLSRLYTVAVVSGRDMSDIMQFIRLDGIIYAGSHGFRISGPDGLYMEHEKAKTLLSRLDEFEKHLKKTLEKEIQGVEVERKHFAIALHYRNAPPKSLERIRKEVNGLIGNEREFKTGRGKKILEIKPALEWHKGKAVEWILDNLDLSDHDKFIPVYIGDDVTDEDAFRTISDRGIGILVGTHSMPSAAHYQLGNVEEVKKFLHYMVH